MRRRQFRGIGISYAARFTPHSQLLARHLAFSALNKQPYAVPPKWWEPKLTHAVVKTTRGYRRWQLKMKQKIKSINVTGIHHLRDALCAGHGVLLTPNHSAHYDSAALYVAADRAKTPLYYMTAWQVFGMASKWDQFLMQRMGCFSIDRESADRKAYKQGVQILQNETCPLVIFPEGDIYHVSDRVTPFREGAAAVAISAAKRSERPIVIVPCGIKFWYVDDPTPKLHALMSKLDERLFLRPKPDRPLKERILRFADAMLTLKEIEFLGTSQSGILAERIPRLAESILAEQECRRGMANATKPIPDRVKDLRQRIIGELERFRKQAPPNAESRFVELSHDMDDLFFAMQLYSYPGDYLSGTPSIERMAETLDKFEEDVLDHELPSVRGRRRVEIRFGEPFFVPSSGSRNAVEELTQKMQSEVQQIVDGLVAEGESDIKKPASRIRQFFDRSIRRSDGRA